MATKDYVCESCQTAFRDNSDLQRHRNRKTPCAPILEEKDLPPESLEDPELYKKQCRFCGRIFMNYASMRRHVRTACKIAPNERNGDARRERRYRHTLQSQCHYCERIFKSNASMRRHVRTACKIAPNGRNGGTGREHLYRHRLLKRQQEQVKTATAITAPAATAPAATTTMIQGLAEQKDTSRPTAPPAAIITTSGDQNEIKVAGSSPREQSQHHNSTHWEQLDHVTQERVHQLALRRFADFAGVVMVAGTSGELARRSDLTEIRDFFEADKASTTETAFFLVDYQLPGPQHFALLLYRRRHPETLRPTLEYIDSVASPRAPRQRFLERTTAALVGSRVVFWGAREMYGGRTQAGEYRWQPPQAIAGRRAANPDSGTATADLSALATWGLVEEYLRRLQSHDEDGCLFWAHHIASQMCQKRVSGRAWTAKKLNPLLAPKSQQPWRSQSRRQNCLSRPHKPAFKC